MFWILNSLAGLLRVADTADKSDADKEGHKCPECQPLGEPSLIVIRSPTHFPGKGVESEHAM